MNKLKLYIACTIATASVVSCTDSYLDKEVDLSLSADQIFSSYDNSRGFLARCYGYLPDAFVGYTDGQFRGASRDCMTDNAVSNWPVHYYNSILSDGYSAKDHPFASYFWENNTKAIRATNQFLINARADVIGNSDKAGDDNRLYERYMAEARLLRAIFTMDMVGYFGAVPLFVDADNNPLVLDPGDAGGLNMSRTPAADVFLWIASECDAIKDALPFRYSNEVENWGRVNGAAAYALKSRALLYRASALNNPDNNKEWWSAAAQAAKDFISKNSTQSNPYKLYYYEGANTGNVGGNYYNCFISTPHLNPEYILSRSEWTTREIELFLAPCGFTGAATAVGRTNPTQNLVDSYETINGLPINEDPSYDPQNPFVNRDPRLEQTILHHGSLWGSKEEEEERAVDVSPKGVDRQSLHGGTSTGYYTKKFLNNMSFKSPINYVHACPIFRYAEILLNAAEAINEAEGPNNAYQYVNEVRERAGMPGYKDMTQERFRERIRNERRIELCFEDHRFFDERRWKLFEGRTADNEAKLPRYQQVINIHAGVVNEDGSITYKNDPVHPTRGIVLPKAYYFPIPYDEVMKAPNLGQNAGWEL